MAIIGRDRHIRGWPVFELTSALPSELFKLRELVINILLSWLIQFGLGVNSGIQASACLSLYI